MYYIIHWYSNTLLVYDAATNLMADRTARTILGAITRFNNSSWDVTLRPRRFIFTEDTVLEHDQETGAFQYAHPIVYKFPSLDLLYLQQHYPELLI